MAALLDCFFTSILLVFCVFLIICSNWNREQILRTQILQEQVNSLILINKGERRNTITTECYIEPGNMEQIFVVVVEVITGCLTLS
jgi:hypothetical protein